MEQGILLEVELRLPDRDQPIRFQGVVVWSRLRIDEAPERTTAEADIQFASIDPQDRAALVQYAKVHALPSTPEGRDRGPWTGVEMRPERRALIKQYAALHAPPAQTD